MTDNEQQAASPETIQKVLEQTVLLLQRGEFDAAAQALQSENGAALTQGIGWNVMGAIRTAQGRPKDALEAFDAAAYLSPEAAEPQANRGLTLIALERWIEAEQAFAAALQRNPQDQASLGNRGLALFRLERLPEALESMESALALNPTDPVVQCNRADVLMQLGRPDDALLGYEAALSFRQDWATAHQNRGVALVDLERPDEAMAAFDRALALEPENADALANRGLLRLELEQPETAVADLEAALALQPEHPRAQAGLAWAFDDLGRFEEALTASEKAIALNPEDGECHRRHGNVQRELGRLEDAGVTLERALRLAPEDPAILFARGTLKLLQGDLPGGWSDQETRWETDDFQGRRPPVSAADWSGEALEGKRILVYSEQGLGDAMMFARFLEPLRARAGEVAFLLKSALRRLLEPGLPGITLIDWPESGSGTIEGYDFRVALMSLPLRLGIDAGSLPPPSAGFSAEPDRVARWREKIGTEGTRIGVCWQGNPQGRVDRGRSFPLAALAPLAAIPGIRLISLQKQHGLDQFDGLPEGMAVERLGAEFDAGPDAFLDSAAIMDGLDLVITCDTSLAHLAGILGRPAWVALKRVPDWRWGLEGETTPWYPSLRLFRQPSNGDWDSVFAAMAAAHHDGGAESTHAVPSKPAAATPASTTTVSVPVSVGELVDKVTILEIKSERLTAEAALANVRRELELLNAEAAKLDLGSPEASRIRGDLKAVNEQLWEIEDRIREKEAAGEFDQRFIELARSVYVTNDKRAALKRELNSLLGSELFEEKSYKDY